MEISQMNFLNFLKTVGHDLGTIGKDVEIGLQAIAPIIALIPGEGATLGKIITEVEIIVNALLAGGAAVTSAQVTQVTQSVAQVQGLKAAGKLE
jgi:hypothetical protein